MQMVVSPLLVILVGAVTPLAYAGAANDTGAATESTAASSEKETAVGPLMRSNRSLLFGKPVIRDWFHFQVAFGLGGGPDSAGVFHAMEVGGTFSNGWTLGLLHTFIQNKGVFTTRGGPDLFGGWMAQLKVPLLYPEFVGKVAVGLGGTHDQSDGIKAFPGLGWSYGIDFHLPFFARSGLTFGLQAIHAVVDGRHHVGFAASTGYTFF